MQNAPGRNVRGLSASISFEAGLAPSSSPAAVRDLPRGGFWMKRMGSPPDEMSEGFLYGSDQRRALPPRAPLRLCVTCCAAGFG